MNSENIAAKTSDIIDYNIKTGVYIFKNSLTI